MKKFKLNQIVNQALTESEMNVVRGGYVDTYWCSCACKYEKKGGASSTENSKANDKKQTSSKPITSEKEQGVRFFDFLGL